MAADPQVTSAHNEANTSAATILSEIGTPQKLNEKILQPMTDESKPLKTYGPANQQQSMTVQLATNNSPAFLTVIGNLSNTGDITSLNLQIDSNFDGLADYSYTAPGNISGTAANGYISCSAGSWSNRIYYLWVVNGRYSVSTIQVSNQDQLRDCRCINSSCGYQISADNLKNNLKYIGDAVVNAIQTVSPHISITHFETSQNMVKYFAQNNDTINTSNPLGIPTETNPQRLYNPTNDAALTRASDDQATQQLATNDSIYNTTKDTFIASGANTSQQNCIISRSIVPDGSGYKIETLNSCNNLNLNGCNLKNEKICDYNKANCIQTIENFNPTGMQLTTECLNFNGAIICNNGRSIYSQNTLYLSGSQSWYYIRRDYECETNNNSNNNATTEINRANSIVSSVNNSGSTATYNDNGINRIITKPDAPPGDNCEKSCKVKIPISNNSNTKNGTVTDLNTGNTAYSYSVRSCKPSNMCPVNPGETIVINCSCIEGFNEAAAVMQSLYNASKDFTCSNR